MLCRYLQKHTHTHTLKTRFKVLKKKDVASNTFLSKVVRVFFYFFIFLFFFKYANLLCKSGLHNNTNWKCNGHGFSMLNLYYSMLCEIVSILY